MSFFPWAFDTPHFNFTTHHPVFFRTPDRAALRMWSWLNWEAMANEEGSPKWLANHKNAKRQGVKACLRPVWNITALRQTWKSNGNTSPPTAMYDLPGLFRTKVRQKPAKLSPNPTFHLVQTSELPRNLADSPWLSFFKRAKLSKLHETTSN